MGDPSAARQLLKRPSPPVLSWMGVPCAHNPHPRAPAPRGPWGPGVIGNTGASPELPWSCEGLLLWLPPMAADPGVPTQQHGGGSDPCKALPSLEAAGVISITPFAPSFHTFSLVNFPRAPISGAGFTALRPSCKVRVKVSPGNVTVLSHTGQGWEGRQHTGSRG